jgi:hypothetical protein
MSSEPKRQETVNPRQAAIDKMLAVPFKPTVSVDRVAYLLNKEYATLLRDRERGLRNISLSDLPEFSKDPQTVQDAFDRSELRRVDMELRIKLFISITPPEEIAHMRWGVMPPPYVWHVRD